MGFQQTDVLFGSENLFCFSCERRSDQDFDELFATASAAAPSHTVESDDATKGGSWIGLQCLLYAQSCCANPRRAWVRMFDDHASASIERLDAFPRCIGIGDIIYGQFFPCNCV